MKIVIDIPETEYELLKTSGVVDWLGEEHILSIVANGKPLPKGHGRLIEANEELFQSIRKYCGKNASFEVLENAPTIIEADKEVDG